MKTDVLLSVTPDGKILDQMPVAVMCLPHIGNVPVMQYEITSDAKIMVADLNQYQMFQSCFWICA